DGRISRREWLLVRMGHASSGSLLPGGSDGPAMENSPPALPDGGAPKGPDLLLPRNGGKP
ncbi:MAG: hypothetical protein LBJ82_05585, partial [Deltaproteobacteria bacterium]|nr:hypothetical protein [Deltaproteobacteria bacterium]